MTTNSIWWTLLAAVLSFTVLSSCEEEKEPTPGQEEPISDSTLVAYYPLDGDTKDYSGYGYHAIPVEEAYSTGITAQENAAYHITSKGGALEIPDFDQEQISVSLWYYYQGTGSFWNTLLYGKNSHHHLLVSHGKSGGVAGELGVYTPGFNGSGYRLEKEKWHHLVLTKDSNASKIYLNGVLVYDTIDFSNTDYPLTVIGNFSANSGTQGTLGKLDEIKIYNKVLTLDEVTELGMDIDLDDPQVVEPPGEKSEEPVGLIAYYPLDGNTDDESGFSNDGTAYGGGYAEDRFGTDNAAFNITEKSDAIDIKDFDQENISVSMWYYYDGTGSFWNTLLYGNSSHHHLLVSHGKSGGEAGELGVYTQGFTGSNLTLESYHWYHLVLTKEGSQTNLYVDKELVLTTQDFSNADYPLSIIGNYTAPNGTQGALGRLDEVRIYDKILTQNEIVELYGDAFEQPSPPPAEEITDPGTDHLLAYYPLNNTTQDQSGADRHAVATGGSFGADRHGTEQSAFVLSDKNDALDVEDFNQTQISVSLWYYYDGTGSFWNTLLYGNSSRHHLIISHGKSGGSAGEIGTYTGAFQGSNTILETGKWYHIVLTKDGNQTNVFVNNILVQSVEDFSNADYPLTVIGNYTTSSGSQGALGRLDEIRIYDKVLTAGEVEYLYKN